MKAIAAVCVALVLVLGIAASAVAADPVTVTGKVMRANCTLTMADAEECPGSPPPRWTK